MQEITETTSTTEPEMLSGETYTCTQYKNTITLLLETQVQDPVLNSYVFEYADNEEIMVHIPHNSTESNEKWINALISAAQSIAGSVELISSFSGNTYQRMFTGGGIISLYNSEGALIDRTIIHETLTPLELRAGNNSIDDDNLSTISYYQKWNTNIGKYDVVNYDTNQVIGSYTPISNEDAQKIRDLTYQGIALNDGVLLVVNNSGIKSKVTNWAIQKYAWTYFARVGLTSALAISKCAGIVGTVIMAIDAIVFFGTLIVTGDAKSLSDIIIDAVFGTENDIETEGMITGYGGGPTGCYTFSYNINNNELSIYADTNSGLTVPKYMYWIKSIAIQNNNVGTDENGDVMINVNMTKKYLPLSVYSMSDTKYNTIQETIDAICVPFLFVGTSNVGRYIIYYEIFQQGYFDSVYSGTKVIENDTETTSTI